MVAGVASRALTDLLLGPDRHGTVVGAMSAAAHMLVGADVVAVVAADAVLLPNAVALAPPAADRPLAGVRAGQPATAGGGRVAVGPLEVNVVRWFDPRPALPAAARAAVASSARLLGTLLTPLEPAVSARADHLRAATEAQETAAVRLAAERLVGLGSGLTPAGDDVVAGALAAAVLLAAPDAIVAALDLPEPRTTTFSASLLRHAARGEVPPQVARLLAAFCGRGEIEPAARALVAVGHSSGAALAAGVAIGALAAATPARGTALDDDARLAS